jgi:hypothetical protein
VTPVSLWSSVLNSQKAIRAGLAALAAYATGLFLAVPDPTWQQFLGGIPAYLLAHYFTYSGTNIDNGTNGPKVGAPAVTAAPLKAWADGVNLEDETA